VGQISEVFSFDPAGRYALVQNMQFGWMDIGGPDPGRFTPLPGFPAGREVFWQPGDRPPLLAAGAADPLAEKAGVAQVQRVLLDHVQIDQAQRHDLAVVVQVLRIG